MRAGDEDRLQQQMQGLNMHNQTRPQQAQNYPSVPQPAPPGPPSGYYNPAPVAGHQQQQPSAAHYYPAPPAAGAGVGGSYGAPGVPVGYPAVGAAAGNPPAHHTPVSVGSGWTAEAVKPEHAAPGQTGGHYGHLQ